MLCGILPDQGSNPCLLHWQASSLPLSHQGSPCLNFYSGLWSIAIDWGRPRTLVGINLTPFQFHLFLHSFINQTCCEYWPYTRSFANNRRRIRHNLYSVFIAKWKSIIFLEQIKNISVQEICLFSLTTKHTETCEVSQGSCMWPVQTGPQSGCHPLLWARTPRWR